MFYHVVTTHEPKPDPIVLKKGQPVRTGEEDRHWGNWIHCETLDGRMKGWVPAQIIQGSSQPARIKEDYTAVELAADPGETLISEKELNQWVWCRNRRGQEGWVPLENLMPFHLRIEENLELRLLEMEDGERLLQLVKDNRHYLRQWLPWVDDTNTLEDMTGFIDTTREQIAGNQGVQAGIWYQGELAGIIGQHQIDWNNRSTSLGYWLCEAHTGKGVMTTACRALVTFLLKDLGLHRVEIRCAENNRRSRGIPERLGFEREGLLRESERLYGHYVSHVVYGMLEQNWSHSVGVLD